MKKSPPSAPDDGNDPLKPSNETGSQIHLYIPLNEMGSQTHIHIHLRATPATNDPLKPLSSGSNDPLKP